MPDPTFLLSKEDYQNIIVQCKEAPLEKTSKYIAYYVLDLTPEKHSYLKKLCRSTELPLV